MIHPDHQEADGVVVRIVTTAPGERTVYDVAQEARRVGMRLVHSPVHGLQQVPYVGPGQIEVGVAA